MAWINVSLGSWLARVLHFYVQIATILSPSLSFGLSRR